MNEIITQAPWGPLEPTTIGQKLTYAHKIGDGVNLFNTNGGPGIHLTFPATDLIPYQVARTFKNGPQWAQGESEVAIVISTIGDYLYQDRLDYINRLYYRWPVDHPISTWIRIAHQTCRLNPRYKSCLPYLSQPN